MAAIPVTSTSWTNLTNGIRVFSRSAGPQDGPVVLLLHGFPSSSHQFRNFIPILAAEGYRVVAPDLPGFGFTEVPEELDFKYTFANIATTISSFLDAANIKEFSVYIFDYGAPTGLRLMLERPEAIKAIISQNGNAYEEGLTSFWDPLRTVWATKPGSSEEKELLEKISAAVLSESTTRYQYIEGEPHPEKIDPLGWTLDTALMDRPGNKQIQLDLFRNYGTNVEMYPEFQAMFKKTQVPLLAVWGKNDFCFGPAGAEAFKKDLPKARVELWDGGHFLVESHTKEVADIAVQFLRDNGIM